MIAFNITSFYVENPHVPQILSIPVVFIDSIFVLNPISAVLFVLS